MIRLMMTLWSRGWLRGPLMWVARAVVIESELQDVTRDTDTFPRIIATGRFRWRASVCGRDLYTARWQS